MNHSYYHNHSSGYRWQTFRCSCRSRVLYASREVYVLVWLILGDWVFVQILQLNWKQIVVHMDIRSSLSLLNLGWNLFLWNLLLGKRKEVSLMFKNEAVTICVKCKWFNLKRIIICWIKCVCPHSSCLEELTFSSERTEIFCSAYQVHFTLCRHHIKSAFSRNSVWVAHNTQWCLFCFTET